VHARASRFNSNREPLREEYRGRRCLDRKRNRRASRLIAAIALEGFLSLTSLAVASRVCALAESGPIGEWVESVAQPTTSALATQTALPNETSSRLVWRRSGGFGGGGEAGFTAIAADVERGWLAVGSEAGLSVGRPLNDSRTRSLSLAGIRDLRFGARGELYIATARGFWVMADLTTGRASELRESSPATGEAARLINRIATGPGFVALATADGAFVANTSVERSDEQERNPRLKWTRLDAGFPTGSVATVAVETAQDASYLWATVGSALWRVRLSSAGAVVNVREILVPGRPHGQLPVDLVTDLPGGVIALVYADSILYRVRGTPSGRSVWQIERPVLPPGAAIARLGHWPGRFWLATDRGLLLSHSRVGPWRRAGPPAGRAATHAAAALSTRFYLAGPGGLLYAARYAEQVANDARHAPRASRKLAPSIGVVHRVALRHQGLETRVFEDAWRGVRRRGWYPAVALRLGVDRDEARARDDDEIFVSGERHLLRDEDKDRSLDLAATLTMTWDLRDLAYEPEQIDLSREARLVIGLRDDVLDEVNQLYFERLAVESELAQLRSGSAREPRLGSESIDDPGAALLRVGNLELRLEEVTAGLDAWTGGWFSEQLERSAIEGM